MKKILLLFIIVSSFAFGEWEIGHSNGVTTNVVYSEKKLIVLSSKVGIAFMWFQLEQEELKKVEPTFSMKELNKLPFVDELEVFLKVDDNEKIMMKAYKLSDNQISLDVTNGKSPARDDKEQEKLIKIGEQMGEGKLLKVNFVKGKNIVEKTYELKDFKEKFEEAKKKNN